LEIEAAALDTVTLQVLPTSVGAHPCMASVFTLLSFGDLGEPDVVFIEHALGATQTEKESEVARATLTFDRLRSDALSPDQSLTLIRRAAERYQPARSEHPRGPQRRRVAQEQL